MGRHHVDLAAAASTAFDRNCTCAAALTWLVWDSLLCLGLEWSNIWNGPMNGVKGLYLFSRYFGLATQVVNCVWVFKGPMARWVVNRRVCRPWFGFQCLAFLLLLATLEIVLGLRIFALYHKSRSIGRFLVFIILSGTVLSVVFGVRTITATSYDVSCNARDAPMDIAYFSTVFVSVHTIFYVLTVCGTRVAARDGWAGNPVLHLMIRDGSWIFLAVIGMVSVITPYTFAIKISGHVTFPLPTSLISGLNCRLILNMHSLRVRSSPGSHPERSSDLGVLFTTVLPSASD